MKATVIEIFQDKITNELHHVGDVINIEDNARLDDLVKRNLVKTEKVAEKVAEKPIFKKSATKRKVED